MCLWSTFLGKIMIARMTMTRLLSIWILVVLSGCNLAAGAMSSNVPVATMPNIAIVQVATPVSAPTQMRLMQQIDLPTNTPVPEPQTTPFSCAAELPPSRPRHQILATIDYAAKTVEVAQQIHYTNRSGLRLVEIVMNVEANRWNGAFVPGTLQIGGVNIEYRLEDNRLVIPLTGPLEPGCEAIIQLTFTIKPPRVGSGVSAFRGYFGYGERQMNLAYWLPVVAPIIDAQWVIHEPRDIGEQMVLEQADWDVTLTINNASGDLKIAAPGDDIQQLAPNQWRYIFNGARDFPISLSEYFRVQSVTTPGGVAVEVYTFPDAVRSTALGQLDAGLHTLQEASQALQQYSDLFGAYPHRRMLVVQGDFPDGMESSGLVFVSTNWFYRFEGGLQNYLSVITVHEVSHQWWYARVGNDAALAPWLDEALATYSEYIYYEEYHPDLKNWWWDFRVGWYNPQGSVDSTVYEFDDAREYINAVYLRGVQMLHNVREDIGTEAFFKLIAEYARVGDGQIATSELFWSLLTPEQFEATRETRGQFLRQPEIFAGGNR